MAVVSTSNTIPRENILWKVIMTSLEKKFVLAPRMNTEFEGELRKAWDTVTTQIMPRPTINTASQAWADITISPLVMTTEQLQIDTVKNIGDQIADYDEVVANFPLLMQRGDMYAYSIKDDIEKAMFSILKTWALTANKLNEWTPVALTSANIFGEIEKLRVALSTNNAFGESALFVSPAIASLIRQSGIHDATETWLSVRKEGYVWRLSWFEIFETNNIETNHMVATVRNAANFAVQFNDFDIRLAPKGFSRYMIAEWIYGWKVFSPMSYAIATNKYT